MTNCRQALSILLSISVTFSVLGLDGCKKSEQQPSNQTQQQQGQPPATTNAAPTADQLYQLVAPIALFPDNLLAQVLAASTYPNEVSDAYTWLQQNSSLKGQQLMQAANNQSWDPSVKGPDAVSRRAQPDGHEPVVDLGSGRCLLQLSDQRDERGAGDAPARAEVRQSQEQSAADGDRAESGAGRRADAGTGVIGTGDSDDRTGFDQRSCAADDCYRSAAAADHHHSAGPARRSSTCLPTIPWSCTARPLRFIRAIQPVRWLRPA